LLTHHSRSRTSTGDLTLGDLFTIRRGLATGDNAFFILTADEVARHQLPREYLVPILPSTRYLAGDVVEGDAEGFPKIDRKLMLLSCPLPETIVRERHPALWNYLRRGVESGVSASYLCRHRKPWYAQELRPPAPLLCTYMGRQRTQISSPFRFILNRSKATAANTYHLLYPKPILAQLLAQDPDALRILWRALNGIAPETMISEGRVYGGGLHKVEPGELANIPAPEIVKIMLERYQDDAADQQPPVEQIRQLALM
jgi:hypothetical protein